MATPTKLTLNPGSEDERIVAVEPLDNGRFRVTLDAASGNATTVDVDVMDLGPHGLSLLAGGRSLAATVAADRADVETAIVGRRWRGEVLDARALRKRRRSGGGGGASGPELTSPMAGKVIGVSAENGAAVEEGQPVLIIEAMKMENVLKAHRSGVLEGLTAQVGSSVDVGDVLLRIVEP